MLGRGFWRLAPARAPVGGDVALGLAIFHRLGQALEASGQWTVVSGQ